jgi:hypothetical protein
MIILFIFSKNCVFISLLLCIVFLVSISLISGLIFIISLCLLILALSSPYFSKTFRYIILLFILNLKMQRLIAIYFPIRSTLILSYRFCMLYFSFSLTSRNFLIPPLFLQLCTDHSNVYHSVLHIFYSFF